MSVGPTGVVPPDPQRIFLMDPTQDIYDPGNNWYQNGGYNPGVVITLSPTETGTSYSMPVVQGQVCRLHLVTNTSSLGDDLDVRLWQMNPYTGIDTVIKYGSTPGGNYDLMFSAPATGFVNVSIASKSGFTSGSFNVDSLLVYLIGGGALTPGISPDSWDQYSGASNTDSWGPSSSDPGNTVDNPSGNSLIINNGGVIGQGASKSYSLKGNTHYRFKVDLINPMPNNDSLVTEISEYDGSVYQLIRRVAGWKDNTRYITSFDTKYTGNVIITVYGTNPDNIELDNAIVEHLDDVVPNSGNVPAMFASGYNSWELALDKYRFGFNTQMKTNELAGVGNHTTALFWEYDTRLGRRWNLDPVPTVGVSDYSVMGGNPILNTDWMGDSLTVGSDDRAITDIESMVREKNRKFVNIGLNGSVTVDFGDLEASKVAKILKNDPGLKLINDLANAREKVEGDGDGEYSGRPLSFLYTTQGPILVLDRGTMKVVAADFSELNAGEQLYADENSTEPIKAYLINASTTPYGTDSRGRDRNTSTYGSVGYDGIVALAPGSPALWFARQYSDAAGKTHTEVLPPRVIRAEVIRHELRENLERTQNKLPYLQAHPRAINIEGELGGAVNYFKVK